MNRHINMRHHQVKALTLPEIGADTMIYGELQSEKMRYMNPSIAFHKGDLKVAIRSCNFSISPHGSYYFRDGTAYSKTDVVYGDLDPDTLIMSNLKKLKLSDDSPKVSHLSGIEDVRIFSREDGMHAIGFESDRITRSLHNSSAKMAEYLIKGDELVYIRTLDKPSDKIVEKNWSPTNVVTKEFDFTYSDTQVWKDGEIIGIPTTTQIHGGTQLLKQKDGTYLSIVHDKKQDTSRMSYDRFIYYHYLAQHSKDGVITKLSKPFRFGTNEKIEFAAGMVEYKDDLLISFGIRDCKIAIARLRKDKLMDLFK